jgi:hypothetical protein
VPVSSHERSRQTLLDQGVISPFHWYLNEAVEAMKVVERFLNHAAEEQVTTELLSLQASAEGLRFVLEGFHART